MDNKIELDSFLRNYCADHPEAAASLGPDFAKLQSQAVAAWRRRRTARRRAGALKAAVIFFVAILLANGVLLFSQTTAANAYKVAVKRFYFQLTGQTDKESLAMLRTVDDDLNKIQGIVPFQIVTPGWLPEGYAMDQAKLVDTGLSDYNVKVLYKNDDSVLIVSMTNDLAPIESTKLNEDTTVDRIVIKDIETFFVEVATEDSGYSTTCNYISNQGLSMFVGGDVDKETLKRIVQSMIEQEE